MDPAAPYLIDYVEARPGGRIGMTPCPGTARFPSARESWQPAIGDDVEVIAEWGAAAVLTLLQFGELTRPALDDLRSHSERRGMAWYHLPIRDGGVPTADFERAWPRLGTLTRHQPAATLAAVHTEGRALMIRTVEAVVDPSGNVRLLADVHLSGPRRALVTILDDGLQSEDTAILSERALADWSRPEEDAAWSHLQPAG